MIPHRILADDIFENGLKDRVTACRKRLRLNRVTYKSPLHSRIDEVFPEATRAASEFLEYSPDHSTRRERLVGSDHRSSSFEVAQEEENGKMLLVVGGQEVGIT